MARWSAGFRTISSVIFTVSRVQSTRRPAKTILGAGFGVSRATAYRHVAEVVRVLAAQTPTLHGALTRVAADGWSHVILDGKLFDTDRLAP
ncbi:hypothetical protein AB0H57_31575 [Micromonospora sp. NPDC050686]|uniref:hypothetical protein n=1 Tax=Micromonospora sp. NPDC050686 TaxID=3154631 RepID=UPI0033F038C4